MLLLEPIEKEIDGKRFILSKFPAVEGREIAALYVKARNPDEEYKTSETAMFKLLYYVAIPIEGREPLRLSTRELTNNHLPAWHTLIRVERAMIDYNSDPLDNG